MIFFSQNNPSLKKNDFFFEGVKVREDWLVGNLFYKESKSKKKNKKKFFWWAGGGGAGLSK